MAGAGILGFVLYASTVAAQDFDRYREFALGSPVATVSTLTGVAGSELKVIHQRPAVIQELTWRPGYASRQPGAPEESVEQLVFEFYDDRLFRVTVGYDRRHTEGLTNADMIAAVSTVYGSQLTRVAPVQKPAATAYDDAGLRVAAWGDEQHSVTLFRSTSYATRFSLVITDESAAAVARTAAARATVLDAREAPQREAALEKQEADARRAAEEKARLANKATFRP